RGWTKAKRWWSRPAPRRRIVPAAAGRAARRWASRFMRTLRQIAGADRVVPAGDAPPLISLRGIRRTHTAGEQQVTGLDGIDLDIRAGELVAIMGASGSGKATLMNVLGCRDRPSAGQYLYAGRDVAAMDAPAQARLRRRHFGFIFQRYHLL